MEGPNQERENTLKEILLIRQEIAVLGGNDSEMTEIQNIINDLNVGKITDEEAIGQARIIINRKNAYH